MIQYLFFFQWQIATLIAVYANWSFAAIEGTGWGWAGVVWLYNLIFYFPLDFIKFIVRYALSGKAWDLVIEQRVQMALDQWSFFYLWNLLALTVMLTIYDENFLFSRLPSQGKRISERKNVSLNGHMHKGPCMVCIHLIPRCSMSAVITLNLIRWLKRQKDELRLQGTLFSQ